MLRFLAQITLSVLSNAIGLIAAALILTGFSLNLSSFVLAVIVFTASTTILSPLIAKIALQNAPYLMGGIALVSTFVGLMVTTILTSGLRIENLSTWFVATFVIWIFSIVGSLLLPLVMFKKILGKHEAAKPTNPTAQLES